MTDDVLTMEELRRRREEILDLAAKHRAHRIAVFCSVARGEARPDSDLDLLVDLELGRAHLRRGHRSVSGRVDDLLADLAEAVDAAASPLFSLTA